MLGESVAPVQSFDPLQGVDYDFIAFGRDDFLDEQVVGDAVLVLFQDVRQHLGPLDAPLLARELLREVLQIAALYIFLFH